jgi:hypothetical protein
MQAIGQEEVAAAARTCGVTNEVLMWNLGAYLKLERHARNV